MSDGPLTKDDFKAGLKDLANQIVNYVDERTRRLEEYVDGRFQELKDYVNERFQEIKEYVDERTHDAETRLLMAFADFNTGQGVRFRKLEADLSNTDASATKRLGSLEEQVADLTIRLMKLELDQRGGSEAH